MCVSVYTECSRFLAVKLQAARCDSPAPADRNITDLMFFTLQFAVQNHIMNLTYSPCVLHALPSSSNLIYRGKFSIIIISKFSNNTYNQSPHSAISTNSNM